MADLLGRLVDKSLVVHLPHTGRWRPLDTVRDYTRQQLAPTDEEADRFDAGWPARFDVVVDDLRTALHRVPPGLGPTAHRLARLGRLTHARGLRPEAVDHYRQAARHAPIPVDATADLRSAARQRRRRLLCRPGVRPPTSRPPTRRARPAITTPGPLLAHAVDLGTRFQTRFAVEIPTSRLGELHQEAAAVGSPTPYTEAAVANTGARFAGPPTPDLALAEQALAAARVAADPTLIWNAVDTVTSAYERQGWLRRAYELARTGLPLLAELDRRHSRPAPPSTPFTP